jgi:L-ribulose-5-phosphate 3-epimerase
MYKIGMMQGRLSTPKDDRIQFFPKGEWKAEFGAAAHVGFDCIEWLYDFHDADTNPISTDSGIEEIKSLSSQYGIQIPSLCAHCFIESPLVGATNEKMEELLTHLDWLFSRANKLKMARIVLPLEDSLLMATQFEFERQVSWIKRALMLAEKTNIEICLETTLPPSNLASFLNQLPHPLLKVNYDIGNSAGMGYHIDDEFSAYGQHIGSIHIKDKLLKGSTVPIGTGVADFQTLARLLSAFNFKGDLVLESARGAPGDELKWAKRNLNFILQYFGRHE